MADPQHQEIEGGWLMGQEYLMSIVNDLDPEAFRTLASRLLENMEFRVTDYRMRKDEIEMEAMRDVDGTQIPFIIKIRRGINDIGPEEIQSIVGKKKDGQDVRAIFISTNRFNKDAQSYADMLGVSIADGDKFGLLLKELDLDDGLKKQETRKILQQEGERFLPSIDELENQMTWGNDFFKSGNYRKAIEYYDNALKMKPNYDLAWIMKGNVLSAMQRYEEAGESFKKALDVNPESEESWYNLGAVYYDLQKFDEEIQCYNKAIEIDPNFTKAWNNKGATLHELGKYEEATLCYDKVLYLEPDNVSVLNNKGVALKYLKDYDNSLLSFDKAIAKKPDYMDAWLNKGLLLHEMERYADSIACYDKVLGMEKSPEVYCQKGITLMAMQNPRKAIESFDNSLLLRPNWSTALEEREKAENLLKEMDEQHLIEEEKKAEEEAERIRLEEEKEAEKVRLKEEEKARLETERLALEEEKRLKAEKEAELEKEKKALEKEERAKEEEEKARLEAERLALEDEERSKAEAELEAAVIEDIAPKPGTSEKALTDDFEDIMTGEIDDDLPPLSPPTSCSECDTELADEARFCFKCGTKVEVMETGTITIEDVDDGDVFYCSECSEEIGEDDIECGECGADLASGVIDDDDDDDDDEEIPEPEVGSDIEAIEPEVLPVGEPPELEAIEEKRAIARELDEEAMILAKGRMLARLDKLDEALDQINKAVALDENPSLWIEKADILHLLGNYDDAIENYDKALKREPDNIAGLMNKTSSLMEIGDWEEALKTNDKVLELEKEEPSLWVERASILLKLNMINEAIEAFDRVIELAPGMSEVWNAEGAALLDIGKHDDAILCFDRAIQIDPDYAEAWCNKGITVLALGNAENSLGYFDRAIDIDSDYSSSWASKAAALYEMERYEEAVSCVDQALSIKKTPQFLNNKGFILLSDDKLDQAIKVFDKAIKMDPEYPEVWNNKGITLSRMDEHVFALECYERALGIDPDFKDAIRNLDKTVRRLEKSVEEEAEKDKPDKKKKKGKKQKGKKDKDKAEDEEMPEDALPEEDDKEDDEEETSAGMEATEEDDPRAGITLAEEIEVDTIKAEELKCTHCNAVGSIDDVFCEMCGMEFTKEQKEDAVIEEIEDILDLPKKKGKKGKKVKGKEKGKKVSEETAKKEFINALVGVPGLGFSRAESVYDAGFKTSGDLEKAKLDELIRIKGISERLAKNIKKVFK